MTNADSPARAGLAAFQNPISGVALVQFANRLVPCWYLERLGPGVRVPPQNDENPALAGLSKCGREESNLHGL